MEAPVNHTIQVARKGVRAYHSCPDGPVNIITLEESHVVVFPLNRIGHWALLKVLVQLKRLVLASKSGSGLPVVGSADKRCSALYLWNIYVPKLRYHLLIELAALLKCQVRLWHPLSGCPSCMGLVCLQSRRIPAIDDQDYCSTFTSSIHRDRCCDTCKNSQGTCIRLVDDETG